MKHTPQNNNSFSDEMIIDKILFLRNCKVMPDRDLAELYGVTPTSFAGAGKEKYKTISSSFHVSVD